jgi:hypothetical protein
MQDTGLTRPPTSQTSLSGQADKRVRPPALSGWRSLGSLKIGVTLMILIGVAMAVATFYESRHGRVAAQIIFYKSPWFTLLLAALALNIFAATVARWPYRLRRIGFPLTHVGILVILAGAMITSRFGVDGHLRLVEGAASNRISIPQLALAVQEVRIPNPAAFNTATPPIEIELPMNAVRPTLGLHRTVSAGETGLRLTYHNFYSNSRWETRYEAASEGPSAARLDVSVGDGHAPLSFWLLSGAGAASLGDLAIELISAANEDELERLLQPEGVMGTLRVAAGQSPTMIDVSEALDRVIQIAPDGPTLRILAYYPDAVVGDDRRLTSRSDRPNNPAVEFEIDGPEGKSRRLLFARFPDFAQMHGRDTRYADIEITYVMSVAQAGPHLRLVQRGDEIHFRVSGQAQSPGVKGTPSGTQGKVQPGEIITSDAISFPIRIASLLPHVREVREPVFHPRNEESGDQPALLVTAEIDGQTADQWLAWEQPATLQLAGKTFALTLSDRRYALPFILRLDRFERETYPGTNRPAMFASHVTLFDREAGIEEERTISMNRPLRYRGYTFFQSGFEMLGARNATVLSVSRDPGKWTVYAGFTLVCLGVVLMVALKRLPARSASRSKADDVSVGGQLNEPARRHNTQPADKEQCSCAV